MRSRLVNCVKIIDLAVAGSMNGKLNLVLGLFSCKIYRKTTSIRFMSELILVPMLRFAWKLTV